MNYTKGEWKAITSRKPDQAYHPQWVIDSDVHWIAVLGTDKYPFPNDEANAHLIAAAPDMYEALKAFDQYLCAAPPDNMKLKGFAVELMDAAIAKAEGKLAPHR